MTVAPDPARASADAQAAAARAGVTVRPLATAEMGDAASLLAAIWGTATIEPPLMVALAHTGAYVAGAFEGERLVGVCVGYFSTPLGEALHSHVAGVDPAAGRRGIGLALKLHQRAWCLERGLTRITWTFDPLVSRNASFNINRLGVAIAEYLVDFYGQMSDGVNAGQGSDRLLASWPLDRDLPEAAAQASADEAEPRASALLSIAEDGQPHPHVPDPSAQYLSVAVPPDIEALRRADPHGAARWRGAVRGALAPLIEGGRSVAGFHDHRYLLENR
ncbi:GNAT family N-acetyltransferase [Demequina sp. SO4-13]|uniref:GNAT family N-acetyltransferase n=1 Tax=Demequina sp. SO4-13 TaxID=3401027 RepID=UPI003AF7F9C5